MWPIGGVLEDGDVELGRLLGLAVEPEHRRDLLELQRAWEPPVSGRRPAGVLPPARSGMRTYRGSVPAGRGQASPGGRSSGAELVRADGAPAPAAAAISPRASARSSSSTGTRDDAAVRRARRRSRPRARRPRRVPPRRRGRRRRPAAGSARGARPARRRGRSCSRRRPSPSPSRYSRSTAPLSTTPSTSDADGQLAVDGVRPASTRRPPRGPARPASTRAPARRPRRRGPGARARLRRPRRPPASDVSSSRSHSSMMRCTAEPSASALARPGGAPGPPVRTASSTCSRPLGLVARRGAPARSSSLAAPDLAPRLRARAVALVGVGRRSPPSRAGASAGGRTSRPPSSYSSTIAAGAGSASAMGPSSTAGAAPSFLRQRARSSETTRWSRARVVATYRSRRTSLAAIIFSRSLESPVAPRLESRAPTRRGARP